MNIVKPHFKECPYCWRQIELHLKNCPYCGKEIKEVSKKKRSFINKLFRK